MAAAMAGGYEWRLMNGAPEWRFNLDIESRCMRGLFDFQALSNGASQAVHEMCGGLQLTFFQGHLDGSEAH